MRQGASTLWEGEVGDVDISDGFMLLRSMSSALHEEFGIPSKELGFKYYCFKAPSFCQAMHSVINRC